MKSRITIEVDFDNGNLPVIQILQSPDSPDVRDKLLKNFIEHTRTGSWLRIEHKDGNHDHNRINIYPNGPTDKDILELCNEMCIESLSPADYEQWEKIRASLKLSRKALS